MPDNPQKIVFDKIERIATVLPETNLYLLISGSGPEQNICSKIYRIIQNSNQQAKVKSLSIPQGEEAKSLNVIELIWSIFNRYNLDRHSCVVSVGGGSVSDAVGFATSTYMRGLPYVNVPTTLLASLDAAIGSKNAINTKFAKNIIGTIYKPNLTFIDVLNLSTLPQNEFKNGMYEAAKMGFLSGEDLLDFIEKNALNLTHYMQNTTTTLEDLIRRCVEYKLAVCAKDPFDEYGIRAALNYGHTLGHAIEAVFDFKISHGLSVGLGMDFAAFLANEKGIVNNKILHKQIFVMNKMGLYEDVLQLKNQILLQKIDEIIYFMQNDKKSLGSNISFVYLENFSKPKNTIISLENMKKILIKYIKEN